MTVAAGTYAFFWAESGVDGLMTTATVSAPDKATAWAEIIKLAGQEVVVEHYMGGNGVCVRSITFPDDPEKITYSGRID